MKKKAKQPKNKVMPHRREKHVEQQHEDEEVEIVDKPRGRRASTAQATALSEERTNKTVRGVAQQSKKRKSLEGAFALPYDDDNDDEDDGNKDANASLDNIFGATTKKKWDQHPKYNMLTKVAATAVKEMGFSTPSKTRTDTTMHKLARQLKVRLPTTRTPAEPILTKAIVVAKLKKLDRNADERYE